VTPTPSRWQQNGEEWIGQACGRAVQVLQNRFSEYPILRVDSFNLAINAVEEVRAILLALREHPDAYRDSYECRRDATVLAWHCGLRQAWYHPPVIRLARQLPIPVQQVLHRCYVGRYTLHDLQQFLDVRHGQHEIRNRIQQCYSAWRNLLIQAGCGTDDWTFPEPPLLRSLDHPDAS
jgi:hypothetical protein